MKVRRWAGVLAGAVLVVTTMLAGSSASAADHAHRLTGDDAVHATAAGKVAHTPHATAAGTAADTAATTAIVPMPDLAITHRLPGGGMNLWRLPISEFDADYGTPQLVKTLNFGGFSYDNSVTLSGDIGDVTASDDGTADHVIWHAQPNGGVLVWGVGGGGDPTPQLWADLRTGGWSYANSTPMLGDVTGDGWDDLVVVHRNGEYDNYWVFPSDGQRLGAPQFWSYSFHDPGARYWLADLDGDGLDEVLDAYAADWDGPGMEYNAIKLTPKGGGYTWAPGAVFEPYGGGWSFSGSRQLSGDVTGDGLDDIITVHAQPGGGILVWTHESCGDVYQGCLRDPEIWQDLKTGGWSFSGSRQYLADTDGDGLDDLVSVHSQPGGGEIVWRALSTGSGFATPEIVANLKTGGWNYLNSREKVASLYGEITF